MNVKVLLFGALAEIAGKDCMTLENIPDTQSLKQYLELKFTGFKYIKYRMAVDKKLLVSNTLLTDGDTVALLPPFAGG